MLMQAVTVRNSLPLWSRSSMCSSMMLFWSPSFVETPRSQPQDSLVPLTSWSRRTVKLGGQDSRPSSMYVILTCWSTVKRMFMP